MRAANRRLSPCPNQASHKSNDGNHHGVARRTAGRGLVTAVSPMTVTTAVRIRRICRRRQGGDGMHSVAGIPSWSASLVKIANSGPRPRSSAVSVFSIRFSARCWPADKPVTLSRPT
jgi:hypothetical protein